MSTLGGSETFSDSSRNIGRHSFPSFVFFFGGYKTIRVAVISAKNHKRQRRQRQSVTAKREKSQTPKFV